MKKLKQKNKGIILGLLLISLIYITTQPTIVDSNGDIDDFEFSHFLKTEELKNPSVAMQIRILAKKNGFKDSNYLINLAYCENDTFDPIRYNARNNYPAWSVDRGVFMINDHWHGEVSGECAFDVKCATEWTIQRLKDGYFYEWVCSKYIR